MAALPGRPWTLLMLAGLARLGSTIEQRLIGTAEAPVKRDEVGGTDLLRVCVRAYLHG